MARNIGFSEAQKDGMVALYVNGETTYRIADMYLTSRPTVCRILHQRGVTIRDASAAVRRLSINEAAFDTLTPDAMYWIGFLYADGSISPRNELSLSLAIRDAAHVEKLRAFWGSTHKVRIQQRNGGAGSKSGSTPSVRLYIKSRRIAERLIALGMVNSRFGDRVAPPELAGSPDFWRGMIDGDGSIGKKSGRENGRVRLCGNLHLLEQFMAFVRMHYPACRAKPRPHSSIFDAAISAHAARVILDILYNNDRVALDRKKETALRILALPEPRRRYL
jgi:hypothetical protein